MFYQPLQFQFFIKIDDKIVLVFLSLEIWRARVDEHNAHCNVLFIAAAQEAFARIVLLIRRIIK